MQDELDLSQFWCWNVDCPNYGKKGLGNIVLKERYGKNNTALLRCKTCGHCFGETRGTLFFGLITPWDEVLRTLAMLPEKSRIRRVARATSHDKDAICRWIDLAGDHCNEVNNYFLNNLDLDKIQIDEIWSYILKK